MTCSICKKNPFLPLHAVHEVTQAKPKWSMMLVYVMWKVSLLFSNWVCLQTQFWEYLELELWSDLGSMFWGFCFGQLEGGNDPLFQVNWQPSITRISVNFQFDVWGSNLNFEFILARNELEAFVYCSKVKINHLLMFKFVQIKSLTWIGNWCMV
jgi:hypothetical protein